MSHKIARLSLDFLRIASVCGGAQGSCAMDANTAEITIKAYLAEMRQRLDACRSDQRPHRENDRLPDPGGGLRGTRSTNNQIVGPLGARRETWEGTEPAPQARHGSRPGVQGRATYRYRRPGRIRLERNDLRQPLDYRTAITARPGTGRVSSACLITSQACRPGFRTRFVGSRAGAASRYGSSIPTTTRCYFKPRDRCS
jgi:hypothetical protein